MKSKAIPREEVRLFFGETVNHKKDKLYLYGAISLACVEKTSESKIYRTGNKSIIG